MLQLIVLFEFVVTGAFAEIFNLNGIAIPDNMSLNGHYKFHVYSTAVGPQVNPDASVSYKDFEIKWSDGNVGIGDYDSLQVSLIPSNKLWSVIERNHFCSAFDKSLLLKNVDAHVPVFNMREKREATFPITETDEYMLIVTNCGARSGATFTKGEVIVKQPHGYLPGNKIWTLFWLQWFTLINAFLCIMWAIATARHYKVLLYIHKAIATCAMMALVEAVFSYLQYKMWNEIGTRSMVLAGTTYFIYCFKYVLTLRMLLETAAGSGVTMERLELRVECKMDVVCALFLMLQWVWKAMIFYKYELGMAPTFLLAISFPGTLLWCGVFVWVFRKFNVLLLQLKEKKMAYENVRLFRNMRLVLAFSILLATLVLVVQFTDIYLSDTPWRFQWVPYDAAPHSVYTIFLLALMILWWPHADSWKFGYFKEVKQDENETGGNDEAPTQQVGVAEAANDKVHPEQIGVAEAEEL